MKNAAVIQEPVAWIRCNSTYFSVVSPEEHMRTCNENYIPLYTAPPAAPVQEPAGHFYKDRYGYLQEADEEHSSETTPLYTTPPAAQRPWVGLTDEEIENCYGGGIGDFVRALEAKLKEKNT